MKREILSELSSQSTWRLSGLSLITFFVYAAHYMKRQTKVINEHCKSEDRISEGFVAFILWISYLSLLLFIAYLFVEETHPIAKISNLVDRASNIAYIVWGFKARNRMNNILGSERKSKNWFHGLWTFLLSPFYFNFKINQLNEKVGQGAGNGSAPSAPPQI